MSSPFFRFKQFTVWHDRCAMKVGTDGVLLGAWCPLPNTQYPSPISEASNIQYLRILDIGTGSGLIALMLAQRLHSRGDTSAIVGIDIDNDAVEQSQINFQQSPWANSLISQECRLQDMQTPHAFDLIVSNPPYFQDSLKNPNAQRATARHTDTLGYAELIAHSARLLCKDGILALVLPIEAEQEILALAAEQGLYPTHITHVHSKPGKPAKRLLIALSPITDIRYPITDTFYIESADAPRSEEYQALTAEFYL
ncbi:MAG: methyltransferase [Paludibacteraceae bacterium]|nr:methyltransferase [Paludibacteraceae bacterium]